jgi:DNA adenine methylase
MILRRLGNKQEIAPKIIPFFPPHKIYVETFFGAGGMFFNKPKAKFNIVNDIDSDVFNLFMVLINQKSELEKAFYQLPIHSELLEYWKKNLETEPLKKALRFLFLSNLTHMGAGFSIRLQPRTPKQTFFDRIDETHKLINDVQFYNNDFRKFLKSICFDGMECETLIYCDPPYLQTSDNYSNSFVEQDVIDLFDSLNQTGCKFAMSEFDNPFILNQAKERNLNVKII